MSPAPQAKWLIRSREEHVALPTLFCFSHAGGSASAFREWRLHLHHHFNVIAVEIPGRGSRFGEAHADDFSNLIENIVRAVSSAIDGPFYLFGHSMGALVAYEVACALEFLGRRPEAVIVSAQKAAHLRGDETYQGKTSTRDLSQSEFIDMLKGYGGMPPRILDSPDMLELYLPVLRADFALVEDYRYTPRAALSSPVWPIGASDDSLFETEELFAWSALTEQPVDPRIFSGGHFYLFEEPEIVCSAIVRQALAGFRSSPLKTLVSS